MNETNEKQVKFNSIDDLIDFCIEYEGDDILVEYVIDDNDK